MDVRNTEFFLDAAICRTCGAEVIGTGMPVLIPNCTYLLLQLKFSPTDDNTEYTVFFCGHIYHTRCVSMKNKVLIL